MAIVYFHPDLTAVQIRGFLSRLDTRSGPDGCWPYTGQRYPTGYGKFRRWYTHRLACEMAYGPIPPKMHCCHSCDNPPCCNPAHLRVDTPSANALDRESRKRGNRRDMRGQENYSSKLTEQQAVEIVRRYAAGGVSQRFLASEYGVSQTCVWALLTGRAWGDVNLLSIERRAELGGIERAAVNNKVSAALRALTLRWSGK